MHKKIDFSKANTVGSIGSDESLFYAADQELEDKCNIVEIRLDLLSATAVPATIIENFPKPLLFTARCSEEGGGRKDTTQQREAILQKHAPYAAAVDIEIASLASMRNTAAFLANHNIPIIASSHDFKGIPPLTDIRSKIQIAKDAGAHTAKFAVTLSSTNDIPPLVALLQEDHGIPLSIMGMGPLGAISRVIFAQYGSVLNYGYLGKTATAPGQWHVKLLTEAISQAVDLSRHGEN